MSKPNPSYQRAKVFYEQKCYAEAEKYFHEALSVSPRNTTMLYELAWSQYLQKGRQKDALATIANAISIDPNESHSHALAALIFAMLGEAKQSLESAKQAVKLDPDYDFSFMALASAFLEMKSWPEAEKAARQALALNPDYKAAAISLMFALREQKKYFEARKLLHYWLSKHPNDSSLLEEKGELDLYTKKVQEAKTTFLDALRLNPNSESAKMGLDHASIGLEHAYFARFLPLKLIYWIFNLPQLLVLIKELLVMCFGLLFYIILWLPVLLLEVIVLGISRLLKRFSLFL